MIVRGCIVLYKVVQKSFLGLTSITYQSSISECIIVLHDYVFDVGNIIIDREA